jgi:predicted 2-oxoglutarate/Fe(II)-dependent dioxygenase YbiX
MIDGIDSRPAFRAYQPPVLGMVFVTAYFGNTTVSDFYIDAATPIALATDRLQRTVGYYCLCRHLSSVPVMRKHRFHVVRVINSLISDTVSKLQMMSINLAIRNLTVRTVKSTSIVVDTAGYSGFSAATLTAVWLGSL